MNEFLQESLKQNCNVDVSFNVVEWQVLLSAKLKPFGETLADEK
jgi:hypothetical protein